MMQHFMPVNVLKLDLLTLTIWPPCVWNFEISKVDNGQKLNGELKEERAADPTEE